MSDYIKIVIGVLFAIFWLVKRRQEKILIEEKKREQKDAQRFHSDRDHFSSENQNTTKEKIFPIEAYDESSPELVFSQKRSLVHGEKDLKEVSFEVKPVVLSKDHVQKKGLTYENSTKKKSVSSKKKAILTQFRQDPKSLFLAQELIQKPLSLRELD